MKLSKDHAKQAQGEHFENLALEHLNKHELQLLERNYHCKLGEIDLILLDKNQLVFTEIRSRSESEFGTALESITPRKQHKIRRTAQYWLQNNPSYRKHICRFDCIGFDLVDHNTQKENCSYELSWIKNAFY